MFVFPANDEGYRKRKRAHKACEQCKRRRRRCDFPGDSIRCEPCQKAEIMCSLAPDYQLPLKPTPRYDALAHQSLFSRPSLNQTTSLASENIKSENGDNSSTVPFPATRTPSPASSGLSGLSRPTLGPRATSYHIGSSSASLSKLNDAKLNSGTPSSGVKSGHKRGSSVVDGNASIGDDFPPKSSINSTGSNKTSQSDSRDKVLDRESIGMWVKGVTSQQRLNPHLHTYLSAISAFSMPLRPNRMALIQLYCESVDVVFPLLDRTQFLKLHDIGQAPTILLHSVLLVAARHPRAGRYLGHESVRQFCANTAAKIRALLFAEVEQDRLTLVRIYALLSLHSEGPDGLENSCGDLEKAIHYAISLGIHHERPFVDKVELKKLWWSVWCMDRISACVNARPLIINNEDMGITIISPDEHSELLRLVESCDKLEKVVYLYRPRRESGEEDVIPPGVDALFMGDDCVDPCNALLALLHYTSYILAHKRINPKGSMEEEAVVSEDSGLTPATKHDESNSTNSKEGASHTPSSYNSGGVTVSKSKSSSPLAAVPNTKFSTVGNYGPRTIGTMYTPLTMVLAEEKLKSKLGASPSIEQRMEDYFTLDTPNDASIDAYMASGMGDIQNKSGNAYSGEDTLLLSAAGSVLRIIKNAVDLPPLPLVPYCISLTMTVFLRTFPRFDTETGSNWKHACTLLEKIADRWWVAGAMGSMGWNVFNSLQERPVQQNIIDTERNELLQQADYAESISGAFGTIGQGVGPGGAATIPGAVHGGQRQGDADPNGFVNGDPTSAQVSTEVLTDLSVQRGEDLYLSMFSDFPNQTSFLDEAINLEGFNGVEQWLQEKYQ